MTVLALGVSPSGWLRVEIFSVAVAFAFLSYYSVSIVHLSKHVSIEDSETRYSHRRMFGWLYGSLYGDYSHGGRS